MKDDTQGMAENKIKEPTNIELFSSGMKNNPLKITMGKY